ncbi:putative RND superfamily exporter [Owenweeksia hongkongensis DSM 17368]|uniref:Putative RND superfamily exporter n=2 Tax=Owenweeksia TaxID=267986 RepID=G8R300_OWEHD|nr:putative RND superfamily exporter [Owenweeksia hongkongensis DSM 17368]
MLSIVILSTAFMLFQGRKIEMSYEFSRLLPLTDSTQVTYQEFQEEFKQSGNTVILAAENINVFEPESYKDWMRLEKNLDTISGVKNILSPINAYNLVRNDSLKKLELVSFEKNFDANTSDSLGKLYNSLPFYRELLYSKDERAPLMLVQIGDDVLYTKSIVRIIESIKKVVATYETNTGHKVHASGLPYIRMASTKKISSEIGLTVGLSLFVTTLIMFLFMRSIKATLITMTVVILGVIWSFGLIASFGHQISMLSALIPSLIIVIGVPNCIFLINKYHSEYKDHKNKIKAVQRVIRKIGAATLLTNTTTALGFAALILTDSIILKEFGLVASINILIVFVISIIVIPIFYSYSKTPKKRHYNHLEKNWINGFIGFLLNTVSKHRKIVYVVVIGLAIVAGFGTTLIKTTGNITEEYKDSDPLILDLKFLEKNFGGTVPLEIVIDTKKRNGVQSLSFLKKVDQLQAELATMPDLSKSLSIVDGIKFAKQAYYNGDSSFYSLPTSQEKNFILSYIPKQKEGLSMLNSLVDSTGQRARISIQAADLDTEESAVMMKQIKAKVNEIFDPERYDVIITGASVIFLHGTSYLIKNLIVSLALAISVIAIIMALLFRSAAMVLVSLVPNLFPLLMTAGLMGYFGIPLKPSTILVFSIAFGISVDDTIHFLAKYRQELRANGWNISNAVLVAIRETGVSMFYTSIVLFFGFSVFLTSSFGGITALGMLVSITLIIAMLSNLLLLPTLLLSLERRVANKNFDHPMITLYNNNEEEEEDEDESENN